MVREKREKGGKWARGAMRTALQMATFFWVGPISLLAAGRGKTGARADFGESSRDRTWRKRRIKTPGGPARLVCRGRNHGAQRDGCDGMGMGENTKVQRGSTEPPPKGELANLGEGVQLAEDLDLDLDSKKPPRKSNGEKQPCRVVARLRLSASTRRHVTLLPPGPKKDQTFHRSRLGKKEAGPCGGGLQTRRLHGQTVAETRFPIGPLFLPRLRHGNLPTVCCRLHAHGAGVCASRAGHGKSHSDPCSGTAVNRLPKHLQT